MKRDDSIFNIIEKEHQRQLKGIELIASENFVSDQVMQAMGSCLTNKYAEGYPGKDITEDVKSLTKANSWLLTVSKRFSVLNGPTYNLIPVPRPMQLYFWPY